VRERGKVPEKTRRGGGREKKTEIGEAKPPRFRGVLTKKGLRALGPRSKKKITSQEKGETNGWNRLGANKTMAEKHREGQKEVTKGGG